MGVDIERPDPATVIVRSRSSVLTFEDRPVGALGGRRSWAARVRAGDGLDPEAVNAVYSALDAEHTPGEGAMGMCLAVDDRDVLGARPEALWRDVGLVYAGYRRDEAQLRVRHFTDALCHETYPGGPLAVTRETWSDVIPLGHGYVLHDLADGAVSDDAITEMWRREGVLDEETRRRRVEEVLAVVSTVDGEVVGVCSAYPQKVPRLRVELWTMRGFVAKAHRRTGAAAHLTTFGNDILIADHRGLPGMLLELENEGLRSAFAQATWPVRDFTYIDLRRDGATVYVHWFDGASAPPPRDLL